MITTKLGMWKGIALGLLVVACFALSPVAKAVPLSCTTIQCDGSLDSDFGMPDIDNDAWAFWFTFDNRQHIEVKDGATLRLIVTFDSLGGLDLLDVYLTDMDDLVCGTSQVLICNTVSLADLSLGPIDSNDEVVVDWTFTADVFIHDFHLDFACIDSNCNPGIGPITPAALSYRFTLNSGPDLNQGTWVPEPTTLALMILGVAGLGYSKKKTR